MRPIVLSVAGALLLAACATEVRDETPGRAEAVLPVPPAAPGLKSWRQIQAEEAAAPPPRDWRQAQQQQQETAPAPREGPQAPPPRRRGSSSPPPDPIDMPTPKGLPQAPGTEAMTDRFKRDLMSPEVDRLRTDDALGRLDPLQQRDLFRKEQDLRQYGTGPLGR